MCTRCISIFFATSFSISFIIGARRYFMKKILFTLAAAIITAGTAYANWQEGSTSSLAVSGGEAAIQINLSAEQRLGINLNAVNDGKADAVFSTAINESNLILSDLPVALYGENGRKDASVSITQFVQTDNGKRFYVFQTGDIKGLRIVSYQKGEFSLAFDGSSLTGEEGDGTLEITKKDLLLHVDPPAGSSHSSAGGPVYVLTFNKATGMFTAAMR